MEKRCFKCGAVKPLTEFYRHPEMADGHLGKCKECTKADVVINYRTRHRQYVEYERRRWRDPGRRRRVAGYQRKRRERCPEKYAAYTAVSNAVRDGRLKREPCVVCGSPKSQAHHDDYGKPLEVTWMCFKCHREVMHDQECVERKE